MIRAWYTLAASFSVVLLGAPGGALALPTDCRNQTWQKDGGELVVMSWHIHYNTVTSDQGRFYNAFIAQFRDLFSPTT